MASSRLRIGCIEYLNSQPLVDALPEVLPGAEIVKDVPSVLADQLSAGELDAALIPVVEYMQHANYHLVPGIAIGCDGPVLSVKLFCRCPIESVRTVALDSASRTSAALTHVLFAKRYHIAPASFTWNHNDNPEQLDADAVLMIGDKAIKCSAKCFPVVLDLGFVWKQWTGLPFVFAVWACRDPVTAEHLRRPLMKAKLRGLLRLNEIANQWSKQIGWNAEQCHSYLASALCYDFGPRQEHAVEHFRGLLETIPGFATLRRGSLKSAA